MVCWSSRLVKTLACLPSRQQTKFCTISCRYSQIAWKSQNSDCIHIEYWPSLYKPTCSPIESFQMGLTLCECCLYQALLRPSGRRDSLLQRRFSSVRDNSTSVNCQPGRWVADAGKSHSFPSAWRTANQECICRSRKEAQEWEDRHVVEWGGPGDRTWQLFPICLLSSGNWRPSAPLWRWKCPSVSLSTI